MIKIHILVIFTILISLSVVYATDTTVTVDGIKFEIPEDLYQKPYSTDHYYGITPTGYMII